VLLLVLDANREFTAQLTQLLTQRGHRVQHVFDEREPPDAMIVGLPRKPEPASERMRETPLLLLAEGSLPFGELEAWIDGRTRWALLSKPVRESSLELSLCRISRTAP